MMAGLLFAFTKDADRGPRREMRFVHRLHADMRFPREALLGHFDEASRRPALSR
jgi:hypothetical protein